MSKSCPWINSPLLEWIWTWSAFPLQLMQLRWVYRFVQLPAVCFPLFKFSIDPFPLSEGNALGTKVSWSASLWIVLFSTFGNIFKNYARCYSRDSKISWTFKGKHLETAPHPELVDEWKEGGWTGKKWTRPLSEAQVGGNPARPLHDLKPIDTSSCTLVSS